MTSADLLRRAATLIRERAQGVRSTPWYQNGGNGIHDVIGQCIATTASHDPVRRKAEAQHLASWHPAVALAVADQLEAAAALASWKDQIGLGVVSAVVDAALQVARAYLGEES